MKLLKSKWFWIALILIAAIILFKMCWHKPVPHKPATKPAKEYVKDRLTAEALKKVNEDSFINVIKEREKSIFIWRSKYEGLVTDYLNEQNDFSKALSEKVPDTCQQYQARLNKRYNDMLKKNAGKDKAAYSLISSYESKIKTQADQKNQNDKDYAELKAAWANCVSDLKKEQDYSKSVKPKRGIYLGVMGSTGLTGLSNIGAGISAAYQNRRGTMYEVGAMQQFGSIQIAVGIKTRIAKF